mgnify:CR=1 FL=1
MGVTTVVEGAPVHEPVLTAEVIDALAPSRGGVFVDCTVGLGGHARALLEGGASRLIGLDRDPSAIARATVSLHEYAGRFELVHEDYRRLGGVLAARGISGVDGILADLGVSSMQLDSAERGFSFRQDGPLDMRMDTSRGPTAAELVNQADQVTLADVIFKFGEERFSRRIASAIVNARARGPLQTTAQLASVVRAAVPRKGFTRIDPATRTFQALRIWVNGELDGLDAFLREAAGQLAEGGRLAVISFHSLEDRIVKHTFRELQASGAVVIRTKRPIGPGEAEIERNPRARSAKLRVVERERVAA